MMSGNSRLSTSCLQKYIYLGAFDMSRAFSCDEGRSCKFSENLGAKLGVPVTNALAWRPDSLS